MSCNANVEITSIVLTEVEKDGDNSNLRDWFPEFGNNPIVS